jgi:hypothetical protein
VSSVLVGSAYGVLELRAQQFDQGVDASLAKLAQLRQAFSQGIPPVTLPPVGGSLPGSPNAPRQLPGGLAPDIQKDEQAMLRYAQSLASAQKAQGALSGAASTYRTVLGQLTPNTLEANRAAASLASTEAALAKEGVGAVSTQLGGLITPLTLATAGFGAATAAVASFSEAFKFKAQLDQNTASIRAQLTGVRDSTQVFNQAAAFAEKYKLTQEETTTAIQASVPLLRQSKASLTDVLTVLSQLQVLKPEQGLQGAAFALAELEGGQSRSLATRFNIPIAKATEMKNEIQKGGDAVQILGKYLDDAGIGATALETRTKGAAGALNDLAIAQERLKLAQADFAQGPGLVILQGRIRTTQDATKLLQGDIRGLNDIIKDTGIGALNPLLGSIQSYNSYVLNAGRNALVWTGAIKDTSAAAQEQTDIEEIRAQRINASTAATQQSSDALSKEAKEKLDSSIASAQLSQEQAQLDLDSRRAAQGLLGAGDQALILAKKYGIATGQAQFLINAQQQLSNATALADQRKGEQTGTDLTAKEFNTFSDIARKGAADRAAEQKKLDDRAKKDAGALLDSEIGLAGAKKNTAREIDLLRQKQAQLDRTTVAGQAEYNQIQAQIIGIQTAGGKARISAAQSTALQLQNVEENSQAQLLKAQREGLGRLRDQQQDFDLHRARSQEDEARKIASLYAHGQRAAAEREKEDFARQQRRDREDFNIQRQRTLRNNAESTGDISGSADRRSEQIGNRAALRGVRSGAAVDLGARATPAIGGSTAAAARQTVAQLTIQGVINLDGKQVASGIWPAIEVLVDNEMAVSLQQIGIPGAGQAAVGGAG